MQERTFGVALCLGHLLLVATGLVRAAEAQPAAERPAAQGPPVAEKPEAETPSETWDVILMQGVKVGYGRTQPRTIREDGQTLRQTDGMAQMALKRLGQTVRITMTMQSVENADGEVLRFRSETKLGPSVTVTTGHVADDTMHMTVTTAGKAMKTTLPWTPKIRGFFGLEQSLEQQPMKPGERRRFQSLAPVFHQVADIELQAADYEQTKMLEGRARLLKIVMRTRLGKTTLTSTVWSNPKGHVLKTEESVMQQTTYRTTRAKALQEEDQDAPDLIVASIIRLDGKIGRPHDAKQVQYRVTLAEGNLSDVVPSSSAQRLGKVDQQSASLVVRRVRIGDKNVPAVGNPPTDRDRKANAWIQSDDPRVVALAKQVVPDETEAGKIALALETLVHRRITKKNFSTAMATAAEVAQSLEGDCTEHAMLLAAVCRARGIPARVVVGLVYVESLGGFGFHMWNEAWIDDRWMPLDATLAQGGTGGGHIKLAHASMDQADATAVFLPVVSVMGKLKIQADPRSPAF